jgi:hypothetical protein
LNTINWGSQGKKIRKKNGLDKITIYGLHGSFEIKNQRYVMVDGRHSSHLTETSQLCNGQYTPQLSSLIEKWASEIGYEKMSALLQDVTGCCILTGSGIQSYLERKAESISKVWVSESQTAVTEIVVLTEIDLYAKDTKEVILMLDDVCVKAQKPHKQVDRVETDAKRLDTTVVMIQDSKETYHYATTGINKSGKEIYSIKQAIIDKVCSLHGVQKPLPIVAITDGARTLRLTLYDIFGIAVCIILDWYHLQLKVKNLMSMIACNKKEKALYIKDLTALLWGGKTAEVLAYIDKIPQVRNEEKRQELRGYIDKHAHEIVDYGLRQKVGKTIGSERVEKGNDIIVARRQKKKGMAWAKTGSASLAIIAVQRLNSKAK